MDYTRSDAYIVETTTGNRMHQSTEPVPTQVSAEDLNMVIWSLMAIVENAGLTPQVFDPEVPATYQVLLNAIGAAASANALMPLGSGLQTTRCQDYLDDNPVASFGPGLFTLDDALNLSDDHIVVLHSGTKFLQTGLNKSTFLADQKDNLLIVGNGAGLEGEGTYSSGWTGNGGHNDRGLHFIGCNNVRVSDLRLINFGHSGLAIIGGHGFRMRNLLIEGTHTHGTPLTSGANFQPGIYLKNDPTYGPVDDIQLDGLDISGTAIGVLDELEVGATQRAGTLTISGNIHDIPGQHGLYLTSSNVQAKVALSDLALAGVKIQAGDANQVIGNIQADVVAKNLGSQMFEVATTTPFTGYVDGVQLRGQGKNVQRAISIARRVRNLTADLVVTTTSAVGVNIQGDDVQDVFVKINGRDIGLDGVYISATNSTGIKIQPTLRNPNFSNTANCCGVRVDSVSAAVELIEPDVTDIYNRMVYGLHNATVGSDVKVRTRATFVGASDTAVRATGRISDWPTETALGGANGHYIGLANIRTPQPFKRDILSVSSTPVLAWEQTLDNNSAVMVRVELTGVLDGGSQRRCVVVSGLFFRNGGICTLQGALDVDVDIASGSFAGVYSLASNGANEVVLQLNSGGTANYFWTARVVATRV